MGKLWPFFVGLPPESIQEWRDRSHSRIPDCRPPFYQREGAVQRRPKLTTSLSRNKRDQQFRTVESGQEVTVVIR